MRFSDRDTNINMPTMTRLWFWLYVKPVSRMRLYSSLAYQSIKKWYQTATIDGRKVCTLKHLKDNVRPGQSSSVKGYRRALTISVQKSEIGDRKSVIRDRKSPVGTPRPHS